jgi:hypothetical protein
MIALRCHTAPDYKRFPDIDTAGVGVLTVDDRACLDELGQYLVQNRAHTRFGSILLHSHFPVESGEILVEEVFADQEFITVRPARDATSGLFATSVCFDDAETPGRELHLVGLEFASDQALAGVIPIDEQDRDVLTGAWRILHRSGKTRRFGIRLLHDPLNLNGRVLLETCDSLDRVLTCRSTTADDPGFIQGIATLFKWEEVQTKDGPSIGQECLVMCTKTMACDVGRDGGHEKSSSHESNHRQVRV